ncbi:hypothetical protein SAMN05216518_12047 [Bacteroidales bacterium KHT7]|nr:hypothetical protein SAMN05216518_12047 [Bacteroidales bacterium KHT7]
MNRYLKVLGLGVALSAVISCTDDVLPAGNQTDAEGVYKINITEPETRFVYDANSENPSKIVVNWAENDQLSVFVGGENIGALFDLTGGANSKQGEFSGSFKCTGNVPKDGDRIYAFYTAESNIVVPKVKNGQLVTEYENGSTVEASEEKTNTASRIYCSFRNQVQGANAIPEFKTRSGRSVDFRYGSAYYYEDMGKNLPSMRLNSLSSYILAKFKIRDSSGKPAGKDWKPYKVSLITEKCYFDSLVYVDLAPKDGGEIKDVAFQPYAVVTNPGMENTGHQTSYMTVMLNEKDKNGNITKDYWDVDLSTTDETFYVYFAVPPTTIPKGQHLQCVVSMLNRADNQNERVMSFAYPIEITKATGFNLEAGKCSSADFTRPVESKEFLLNGEFFINPVYNPKEQKWAYQGLSTLNSLYPYYYSTGSADRNAVREATLGHYREHNNYLGVYDTSFDGMYIETRKEGDVIKGSIIRYTSYPVFGYQYEGDDAITPMPDTPMHAILSNVEDKNNQEWFARKTHAIASGLSLWPRKEWLNSWDVFYAHLAKNGNHETPLIKNENSTDWALPGVTGDANLKNFMQCPFVPVGCQGLEYGAVPPLASANFWADYSNYRDGKSEEFKYNDANFNLEYENLGTKINENYKHTTLTAAWYSEYLIRNGARMDDYYKNYGEFEINFNEHYYTEAGGHIVDNGIWTYKGGVSFPLAFFLHNHGQSYERPANIRDYSILVLDGEEFRLTHTTDGKREVSWYTTPCNIWCFKRK